MATLTDVEELVLLELGEDLTTPQQWSGEDTLRDALGDAIDEMAMTGELFSYKLIIPLAANVAIYSITLPKADPFVIKRAIYLDTDRRLVHSSLQEIAGFDGRFLVSRGSPYKYVPLSTDLVLFYPFPSSAKGAVELTILGTPQPYAQGTYIKVREELEQALVHYGKYFLLMQERPNIGSALEEYGKYLQKAGMLQEFKHHQKMMQERRLEDATRPGS